jgi:polysaccharide deacetylase family protein (PEP-CTERM system associated)
MNNILSVDVEDWFHILDVPSAPRIEEWDSLPSHVEMNFRRLLELFARHQVHATCFFLGWVAERFPHLVQEAVTQGHEVASHGYSHMLAYEMSPQEFLYDIRRAKETLENATGQVVIGYRAPGFSATDQTPWFFEKIIEAGYRYDSSVFPARRGHGGIAGSPCEPYAIQGGFEQTLVEFPISVVNLLSARLCLFGGGYLRLFPWWLTKAATHQVMNAGRPVIFYVHPREIDPNHPRLPMNSLRGFKSYVNLETTKAKLDRILKEFTVSTFRQYLEEHSHKFPVTVTPRVASSAAGRG